MMTAHARHLLMSAGERESTLVLMSERHFLPSAGSVAVRTICLVRESKLAIVDIMMARFAFGLKFHELQRRVTLLKFFVTVGAGDCRVLAREPESGRAVIVRDGFPSVDGMAITAALLFHHIAEFAPMEIAMTSFTCHCGEVESQPVLSRLSMAVIASDCEMCAGKLESALGVSHQREDRWAISVFGVAPSAIILILREKLAVVFIGVAIGALSKRNQKDFAKG